MRIGTAGSTMVLLSAVCVTLLIGPADPSSFEGWPDHPGDPYPAPECTAAPCSPATCQGNQVIPEPGSRMGICPTRGGLVLTEGEELLLTGSHDYNSIHLGRGSSLRLVNCSLNVTGDGASYPTVSGEPALVEIENSTMNIVGLDGSGLIRDQGDDALFRVNVSGEFRMADSAVNLIGGRGWQTSEEGAYMVSEVSGHRFGGGNCSFFLTLSDTALLGLERSSICLKGGKGGDAPDAAVMTSDGIHPSGGYTVGCNVSGTVGSGGNCSFMVKGDGVDAAMSHISISLEAGDGGDAGASSSIPYFGDVEFNYPVPPGGYSTRWISGGSWTELPTVSGLVGSGGSASLGMEAEKMRMHSCTVTMRAGKGGEAADGADCRSVQSGPSGEITWSTDSGGGGGYAGSGGSGRWGFNGGDVLGQVGRGGDTSFGIHCGYHLETWDVYLDLSGGDGGMPGSGGLGGGISHPLNIVDGGGGGGGGFSGASGTMLSYSGPLTQGQPGSVGPEVGRGGNCSLSINGTYFTAGGNTMTLLSIGRSNTASPLDGGSGEFGGDPIGAGGYGGKGELGACIDGRELKDMLLPGPIPHFPEDGGSIRDPSTHFEWEPGTFDIWTPMYTDYEFRLLGSEDPGDVIESGTTSHVYHQLSKDPGDGTFYWTVRCKGAHINSSWSPPRKVHIDRDPPRITHGEEPLWLMEDGAVFTFNVTDTISGADPAATLVRVDLVGGENGTWGPTSGCRLEGDTAVFELEMVHPEGNYSVWISSMDRAGNGPVVLGPVDVRIDGTPPLVTEVLPEGWIGELWNVSFSAMDELSGLSCECILEVRSRDNSTRIKKEVRMICPGGDRYLIDDTPPLSTGNWSYNLTVRDAAGNRFTTGDIDVAVDTDGPLISMSSPQDGIWSNDSAPEFVFGCSDGMSGVNTLSIRLFYGEGVTDLPVSECGGEVRFRPSVPLEDGWYGWCLVGADRAGNHRTSPMRHFGIDTAAPVVELVSVSASGGSYEISYNVADGLSGNSTSSVQRMEAALGGFIGGSVFNRSGEGRIRLVNPLHTDDSVLFLRVRAADCAGNVGGWSEVIRIDVRAGEGRVLHEGPLYETSEKARFRIWDPLGVNISSLSAGRVKNGSVAYWDVPFVLLGTEEHDLNSSSGLAGPCGVTIELETGITSSGEEVFAFRWRDLLPLAESWRADSSGVLFDLAPPGVALSYKEVNRENRVMISVEMQDDMSGPDREWVRATYPTGVSSSSLDPSGPCLESQKGGMLLHVNISWGPLMDLKLTFRDNAGNIANRSVTVRATRAPEVEILNAPEGGRVPLGEVLTLHSQAADPDGDEMNLMWFVDGSRHSNGTTVKLELGLGNHTVELVASDGDLEASANVTIEVFEVPSGGGEEGSGALLVVMTASGALVLILIAAFLVLLVVRSRSYDDNVYTVSTGSTKKDPVEKRCPICMRSMRKGKRHVKCRCGAAFHNSCAMEEGVCPECGRELMISEEE